MKTAIALTAVVVLLATGAAGPDRGKTLPRNALGFGVRPGYEVTLAIPDLDGARFMEFDDKGTLYVSRPSKGDIVAFRDDNADGTYEKLGTFVTGKPSVHGLCFSEGWLYFSTSEAIRKARDTSEPPDGKADEVVDVIAPGKLPKGGGHWWRSLLVTKDSIFTSIGDAGNASIQADTDRQKIWKFSLDGENKSLWCSGIRNTEKLRLRPGTGELWGCDHGSDNFGQKLGEKTGVSQPITDLNPPCEFNRYTEGGFYGHPFITGNRVPRIEFQDREDIVDLANQTTPPEWCFGGHWAPNGFCFINPAVNENTKALPADVSGDAFVAFHGSWNSVKPVGYQVARVLFDKETGKPYGLLTIVDALGANGKSIARPVDCVQGPDGSVFFSCDDTGRVFRIRASAK